MLFCMFNPLVVSIWGSVSLDSGRFLLGYGIGVLSYVVCFPVQHLFFVLRKKIVPHLNWIAMKQ